MRKQHVRNTNFQCNLIALICLVITVTGTQTRPLALDPQTKAWNEIVTLYNQGYDIVEKQQQNPHDPDLWRQRKTIFTKAATKLELYIRTYITDATSITYLRTKFRLGTFWEIAQNFSAARESYLVCKNHPLFKDSSSVFDGQSIESQVNKRLVEVEANMRKRYSSRPGYIYVHRGGGNAIFEEEDIEFLPNMVKDLCP